MKNFENCNQCEMTLEDIKRLGDVIEEGEIEKSVREAIASGTLTDDEILNAHVTLNIPEINLKTNIDGQIKLN